jgi:hypothetical protein
MTQLSRAEELDKKCWPIFEKLQATLAEEYENWLVAIEPGSGEYFLGQDDYEVLNRARKKHPQSLFFLYRLGQNSVVNSFC